MIEARGPGGGGFAWTPTAEQSSGSNVGRLARRLGVAGDYHALHRISLDEPDRFWRAVRDDLGIPFFADWETALETSRGDAWATWFLGSRVNIAEACLYRWERERPDEEAAVWRPEAGERSSLTWAELAGEVRGLAAGLVELGVRAGDTVATFLPMTPHALVASHACSHVGAIQVPIFSGFAAPAVTARLVDAEARVVLTAWTTERRGRPVPMKAVLDEALVEAPDVEHVVVWRSDDAAGPLADERDRWWDDVVRAGRGASKPLELESEHPYLLAYTSGTTGRPKGAVHTQASFLLSIARECAYQSGVGASDRVLFATDMGWIMGPWTIVGAGVCGACTVFMEGAPDWPADRLWRLVEDERVTMLGVSPTLVRALIPHGDPVADLSSLEAVTTTGEPWNRGPYDWLNEHVCGRGRIPIVNISGGTEVGACFLSTTWLEPSKPVSLGFPALGLEMDVVDDAGSSVRGAVGELVCRRPWPGMTRGLWRDPDRYLETYWSRFPGVWTHGDWASVDEDGYWYLHGRSDDTLNVAGKRIGPAELESAALGCPAVQEAAAIGMPDEVKGEVPWLFVVLRPGERATADEVSSAVSAQLGKAFAPTRVLFVPELPKTRSQKIVRRALRSAALGTDPGDVSTLENPGALDSIAEAVTADR